ncbi:MAG: carbohydrate ABC transporter permease [Actinomycetaceae bacterium]|nr:carbohydrate ABC transporter permease [Actinomycetaceae bacterium]MDY6083574.1 carbohydrate ABC transporter permease [Actinomycetaceae bacterium]
MNAVGATSAWQKVLGYAVMIIVGALVLIPVYWIVLASVKIKPDIYSVPATYLPHPATTQNYTDALNSVPLAQYLRNSVIITVFLSLIKITLGVVSGFAFSLIKFPGRNILFIIVIATLMVPDQVTVISNYALIAGMGWRNTFQGIILPLAGTAFGTFLMRNHFLSLPSEIIEAATIDGAGPLKMLWKVVLPMSWPTLSAFSLITVVNEWNQYLWPFLMSDDERTANIQIGLTLMQNSDGMTNWGPIMAGTVLSVIPMVIVFLFLQKNMIKGLTAGAVKS